MEISCEVLNPSWMHMKGTLDCTVERWQTSPRSITSWTPEQNIIAKPVCLVVMTSEYST